MGWAYAYTSYTHTLNIRNYVDQNFINTKAFILSHLWSNKLTVLYLNITFFNDVYIFHHFRRTTVKLKETRELSATDIWNSSLKEISLSDKIKSGKVLFFQLIWQANFSQQSE